MATKRDDKNGWYDLHVLIDPWSYRNLLRRQRELGAKYEAQAVRYTLRRMKPIKPRRESDE